MNFSQQLFKGISKHIFTKNRYLSKRSMIFFSGVLIHNIYFGSKNKIFAVDNKDDQINKLQAMQQNKAQALKILKRYEVGKSSEIEEGQIKEFYVTDEGSEDYPIVIIRWKKKLFAIGGICTHDGKTKLSEGICFENKLYCPIHGCAYNISNGQTEYCPAIDDLPKFYVEEKQGQIILYAPQKVPKRILPYTYPRAYGDPRKVVIIGSGVSAMGCIETLKKNGYEGEITMITQDFNLPYDKTQLSKQIKDLNYDKLQLRDMGWFKENGITCYFEDGLKIEFDALVLALGSYPAHKHIPGLKRSQTDDILYLRNIRDHKKLKNKLFNAKTVTIMGSNFWALETAQTIRREYKNVKDIYIIDQNEDMYLKEQFGNVVGEKIIDEHLNQDMQFVIRNQVTRIIENKDKRKVLEFENGVTFLSKFIISIQLQIDTDLILLFPTYSEANTDMIQSSQLDNFQYDEQKRILTDFHSRSAYKRIFSIGDCAAMQYFGTSGRISGDTWNVAYHQGENAAYNILGLRIPYHRVPFYYTNIGDKILQVAGYLPTSSEVYIDGDIDKWDFIAYFAAAYDITGAVGTPSKRKAMQIVSEALRLQIMPMLQDVQTKQMNLEKLEKQIRDSKRSGCFRERIYDVRYQPYIEDELWMHRERQNKFVTHTDSMIPTDNIVRDDD